MRRSALKMILVGCGLLSVCMLAWPQGEPAKMGPQTEKRFPPLQVPAGFKANLFACDPLVEYPSAMALGPKPGSLLVAVDYLTGLGTDIIRRDEIRLIEDTDGDGYADKATVFAAGFNSIQGLTFHDGTLYVMHAPYLTALRDTKGTGKADERRDLVTGLGLPPEKDQIRLHNANGVVMGHDGWLYLAMGDRGCDVKRLEGDRLVLEGGGILRCRADGRDLHIFSTGLRNIYDVALDADLNVFVRDNENDGGAYKIRVCQSFFGADHGYPYLYYERPDEALAPLADLGLGSSAGGLCYLESHFPANIRGSLFFCEWGRAVVRYQPTRKGASFGPLKEVDFAAGAANDPYGFKPTDLVVDREGSLFIADWADGQRPKRGRGRIYRVRHDAAPMKQPPPPDDSPWKALDSTSYYERCASQKSLEQKAQLTADMIKELDVAGRLHAVWILAKGGDAKAVEMLWSLATSDPEPRVQAQAIRALGDVTDPVLVRHRLDAGAGDDKLVARFAELGVGKGPSVLLEVVVALGRLRWTQAPTWLAKNIQPSDPTLAHAALWTLRRANNWPGVLKLLDEPANLPMRAVALRALADQYEASVVDGLIERLDKESSAARRREYADVLTRIHKKSAPWTYWGFRPPPRPAPTVAWQATEKIEKALDHVLRDPDIGVRRDILARMVREKIPTRLATLTLWLDKEQDANNVAALLAALSAASAADSRSALESVLANKKHSLANRRQAATLFVAGLDVASEQRLLALAKTVEDGLVLADLLRAVSARPTLTGAASLFSAKLNSPEPEVRACAIEGLAALKAPDMHGSILQALKDPEPRVRRAAAQASGQLGIKDAADLLLPLARAGDPQTRSAVFQALRRLREPRAVPLAVVALDDRDTALAALEFLEDLGGPEQIGAVTQLARRELAADVLAAAAKVLVRWAEKPKSNREQIESALAELHGHGGVLLAWQVRSVGSEAEAKKIADALADQKSSTAPPWRLVLAAGLDARLRMADSEKQATVWLGMADVHSAEAGLVEFAAASPGLATIWVNGVQAYRRDRPGVIGPYPDRFDVKLPKGRNRVVLMLTDFKGPPEWQVRLRGKSAGPEIERFTAASLARAGNPARGREVFLNAEKSLCVKCHRVGDQGERIGPELTGLGSRFSKIHIIESVLQPNRTIAPSYESFAISLKNGKVLTGVKLAENDTSITLVDQQAAKHVLAKSDIDAHQRVPISAMPDGVERRMSEDDFVDLVSYLVNLKEKAR